MINRVADNIFSDEAFEQIINNLKQNQKHLFSIVNNENEAKTVIAKLKQNGYNALYEQDGNYFNVFYSPSTPKVKATKQVMANFNCVNNNEFVINGKSVMAGIYDCAYDDGSIWTLQEIDGEKYLVKEIIDNDENNVIRKKKTASNKKPLSNVDKQIIAEMKNQKLIVSVASLNQIKDELLSELLKNNTKRIASVVKNYKNEG